MSVDRADRTGPTGFDSSEWNRAANRVIPPSTPSSKTTSAWLSPTWGRALGALSIFTTRTGRFDRTMSIGSPVRGDADMVGGAGAVGGRVCGPIPGPGMGMGGGWATFAFGLVLVVVVLDAAFRVVVVVGFGRVVVVVDVDEVVVGGGFTVSTRRKSVPQALPTTRSRTTGRLRNNVRWRWALCAVMSATEGTGRRPGAGGPPGEGTLPANASTRRPPP